MSRLVLHIGTHKTATTTIQKTFFDNRDLLHRHGIVYPDIGRMPGHHGLVTGWIHRAPSVYRLPEGAEAAWTGLAKKYADSDKSVFVSSEEFSRGRLSARTDFRPIRGYLANFDEVEVFCVLRDQLSVTQSVYLEMAKKRVPHAWPKFFQTALKKGYAGGIFLNYNDLYDHLLAAFAPEEIRFFTYEAARRHPGGVLGMFLEKLGTSLSAEALKKGGNSTANISPPPLPFWVASEIAGPRKVPPELIDFAADIIAQELESPSRTTLYSLAEEEALREQYAPLNARFQARLPDQELNGLSLEVPSEAVTRRDAITERFWIKAAQALYKRAGRL